MMSAVALAIAFSARTLAAQITPQMRDGIPGAFFVSPYSVAERASAAQRILQSSAPPTLGDVVSLTPNSPYAQDGSHLSVWKPSFVLGTASGGEIGVSFWGIHTDGHVNVGFTQSSVKARLLDCRLLSTGPITFKIYQGITEALQSSGQRTLERGHLLLLVPASDGQVSVELWPTPTTVPMGFFGCELSTIN
jgi:hypothetical protein